MGHWALEVCVCVCVVCTCTIRKCLFASETSLRGNDIIESSAAGMTITGPIFFIFFLVQWERHLRNKPFAKSIKLSIHCSSLLPPSSVCACVGMETLEILFPLNQFESQTDKPRPVSVLIVAVTSADPRSLLDPVQVFPSPALMGVPPLTCVIMTERVISPSCNWTVLLAVLTEVTVKGSFLPGKSKHKVAPHDWLFMLWSAKKGTPFAFLWHSDWK